MHPAVPMAATTHVKSDKSLHELKDKIVARVALTLTVLVKTIDALRHFETG